jgi:hypothetical protein
MRDRCERELNERFAATALFTTQFNALRTILPKLLIRHFS